MTNSLMFYFMMMSSMLNILLMFITFYFSKKMKNSREKNSPFECGFMPLHEFSNPFSIQFYLISVVFLIFDIEITLLIPSILNYKNMNLNWWLMLIMYFFFIVFIGLMFEWYDKSLNWLN